ncbi:unnamed protein product [Sympodiomycopsis kandeliae]
MAHTLTRSFLSPSRWITISLSAIIMAIQVSSSSEDGSSPPLVTIKSILDTDLYKLTMQQALRLCHDTIQDPIVSYKFTNRSSSTMKFNLECVESIKQSVQSLSEVKLTSEEYTWLQNNCPYLRDEYLDYLRDYRFDPENEVDIEFVPESQDLSITIKGNWSKVILYEVPLMSIVSEVYFTRLDTQWDMSGQRALAKEKSRQLISNGIRYSEFGSRRRRSYLAQEYCIQGLLAGEHEVQSSHSVSQAGKLIGTSNVHFAQKYNLVPIGTVAHEWTMGLAAILGYDGINLRALELWNKIYNSSSHFLPNSPTHDLTIALTDTFSSKVFFQDLLHSGQKGKEIARSWRGLRQDSGDSKKFALQARDVYKELGVDPKSKVVIYSDSLNVDKCVELQQYSKEIGIGAGFGIGTFLTNDFNHTTTPSRTADPDALPTVSSEVKSKPLNMVIKLSTVNGRPAVKISDDLTKNTGDPDEVMWVKRRFGLVGLDGGEMIPEDG